MVTSTAAAGAVWLIALVGVTINSGYRTERCGAGRLVEHANRLAPWLAPGQRPITGPGIREFWMRYFVNSDLTSEAERRVERFVRGTGSKRGSVSTVHRVDWYAVMCVDGQLALSLTPTLTGRGRVRLGLA